MKSEYYLEGRSLSLNDLNELEEMIGYKLPDRFKSHYLKHNGGSNADRSKGVDIDYPFGNFLSIKYGEDTVENKIDELKHKKIPLDGKLVFAKNGMGSLFTIDLKEGDDYGKIYVLKTKGENIIWEYHCENFESFLKGLNQSKFYRKRFDPKQLKWVDLEN